MAGRVGPKVRLDWGSFRLTYSITRNVHQLNRCQAKTKSLKLKAIECLLKGIAAGASEEKGTKKKEEVGGEEVEEKEKVKNKWKKKNK